MTWEIRVSSLSRRHGMLVSEVHTQIERKEEREEEEKKREEKRREEKKRKEKKRGV